MASDRLSDIKSASFGVLISPLRLSGGCEPWAMRYWEVGNGRSPNRWLSISYGYPKRKRNSLTVSYEHRGKIVWESTEYRVWRWLNRLLFGVCLTTRYLRTCMRMVVWTITAAEGCGIKIGCTPQVNKPKSPWLRFLESFLFVRFCS